MALLESVMNTAEMAADLQVDDDVRADLKELIMELGRRFSMTASTIQIEEHYNEDGSIDVKITPKTLVLSKPKLELIVDNNTNDNHNKNPVDD
jgi:hypothetical protein